jgi:2-iminobutanoate/2-iminopropanoate deaminase
MKKTEIRTQNAPLPAGPYSQAVRVGDLLFISGILPLDLNKASIPKYRSGNTTHIQSPRRHP